MTKTLKEIAREKFQSIKEIDSPVFPGEKISFNAKGLNHILYKGPRSGRRKSDAACKVRLLDRAVKLLETSTIHQEEDCYMGKYRGKTKIIKFWAFEGIIDNRRIKVIVKQVGEGKKHFWSVIPSWRKSRFGEVRNVKSNIRKQ